MHYLSNGVTDFAHDVRVLHSAAETSFGIELLEHHPWELLREPGQQLPSNLFHLLWIATSLSSHRVDKHLLVPLTYVPKSQHDTSRNPRQIVTPRCPPHPRVSKRASITASWTRTAASFGKLSHS